MDYSLILAATLPKKPRNSQELLRKTTRVQFKHLLQFVAENKRKLINNFKLNAKREKKYWRIFKQKMLHEQITPERTSYEWKQIWTNWKNNVLHKSLQYKIHEDEKYKLTELETEVLYMIQSKHSLNKTKLVCNKSVASTSTRENFETVVINEDTKVFRDDMQENLNSEIAESHYDESNTKRIKVEAEFSNLCDSDVKIETEDNVIKEEPTSMLKVEPLHFDIDCNTINFFKNLVPYLNKLNAAQKRRVYMKIYELFIDEVA